jgi:hypothetical protein
MKRVRKVNHMDVVELRARLRRLADKGQANSRYAEHLINRLKCLKRGC